MAASYNLKNSQISGVAIARSNLINSISVLHVKITLALRTSGAVPTVRRKLPCITVV